MTEINILEVAERADIIVRELRENGVSLADMILRSASDTITGVASPFEDRDHVGTRRPADPGAAFAAERDGQPAGKNFTTSWGSGAPSGPSRCARRCGTRASPAV